MPHATRGRTRTPPNPIRRPSPRRWLLVHRRRDTDDVAGQPGPALRLWARHRSLGPPPLSGPATAVWARHRCLGPPPLSGPATAAMAMNGPGIRVAYRVRGELRALVVN